MITKFKIFENKNQKRAGVIPYYGNEMMFFIPSDPAYGGDEFQIAKGRVDGGEDVKEGAIREAEEELGLIIDNVKEVELVEKFMLTGFDGYPYEFYLYIAEVYNKEEFNKPHYETGETGWLSMEEYENEGRKSQLDLVRKAYQKIKNKS